MAILLLIVHKKLACTSLPVCRVDVALFPELEDTVNNTWTEISNDGVNVDVRMCKECRSTVFGRRDFAATLNQKPPDVKAFENLIQFEAGIKSMLPRFQRLLVVLQ